MNFTKHFFHPKTLLDDAFELGIILKGLGGVVEIVSGTALLFTSPVFIHNFVVSITHAELLKDPDDFIASHLNTWSAHLGAHATLYGAIYLLSHGILKIVIVGALLLNQRWAYPAAIVTFTGFAIYQVYATVTNTSIGMALLTIYDVVVIWLVWQEYQKTKLKIGSQEETIGNTN